MFNVAHFVSPYLPGTQTFIYNYIKAFVSCDPYIFTYEVENLEQFEAANLSKLSRYSTPWVLYRIAEKLGMSGRIVDKWLFNLNNTKSIRSRLKQNDIQLIHAHFGYMGCYSINLKKATGLPMVTTFYGWDMSFLPFVGWGKRYMPLFNTGDCFFVEGSNMKKGLCQLGCPEDKIKIIHIGVDPDKFKFKERRRQGGKTTLLFCGRLIEKKGLEYALRALAVVKDKYKDVEFKVIGDGPLKEHVGRLVRELALGEMVKLIGHMKYSELKKEMDKAHILVQPSVTASNGETEGGAPTVLIEAQSSGMPILASFHADIPEVVLDGKSGLLSEERNVEQLADHMAFLLDYPEKWAEMGLAGRRHVEENYNIKTEARKMEQIYTQLINQAA